MNPLAIREKVELVEVARKLLSAAGPHRIFAFYAEMGAGKTTFISVIASVLGVEEGRSSPTYAIVNEYRTVGGEPVFHFDFYRIHRVEEAYDIGCEDYFYSGHYCFVEWPERVEELLPDDAVKVYMRAIGGQREIYWELPH